MQVKSTNPGMSPVKVAMLTSQDLRPNERLVLVAIAAHANRDGDAWPSVATIAEYVGVSVRTVQRTLAKLVQLGRLAVRQVATIATRIYRLVTGGGDNQREGVTTEPAGGDSLSVPVSPEVEKTKEKKNRADARDWRRFIPKNNNPERRGAALPPAPGGDRCQRPGHVGQLASNCVPCRSERLGRVA